MSFTILYRKKTPFQAIKIRREKSRNIEIFLKGLTHGCGPNMAISPTFYFQAIQARKMSFTIFQSEKTPFQDIKIRSSNSRKIDIFIKGLTHAYGPKMAIFETLFFRQYRPGKCLLRYSRAKKRLFSLQQQEVPKVEKIKIFPKGLTHGFGPKMANFPLFVFQAIQARKMSFTICQSEKTPFQAIKTRSSKSRNIDIFPKGLTHGFGPKMAIF